MKARYLREQNRMLGGPTRNRSVADFEIKVIEEGWLLTPTTRAARLWCKSHLTDEAHKAGDGYMVEEQLMLQIIEQFMDRKTGWFGS